MKLRLRGNSLRLRLNQKEVELLAQGVRLSEQLIFPAGTALQYSLEQGANKPEAKFVGGRIQILVPSADVGNWAKGAEIGLYFSLPAEAATLQIAIEKDLVCIDGPEEEADPDAFPREFAGNAC